MNIKKFINQKGLSLTEALIAEYNERKNECAERKNECAALRRDVVQLKQEVAALKAQKRKRVEKKTGDERPTTRACTRDTGAVQLLLGLSGQH